MILSHVSLMRSTETPDLKITINRNSYHLANLPSSGISAKVLLKAVEQVTGIPSNKQMLFFNKKAIDLSSSLKLDNGSCVDVIVKGCGGSGETNAGS